MLTSVKFNKMTFPLQDFLLDLGVMLRSVSV